MSDSDSDSDTEISWLPAPTPAQPSSVFDTPARDLTLEVDGRKLHVHKSILANASVVFERMFNGDFQEKHSANIPLPNKSYDDIVEMLLCIYPSQLKAITREKVDALLQLADEYQMVALTRRCERFLVTECELMTLRQSMNNTELVHFMYLADKYNMNDLVEKTTDIAAERLFKGALYGHPNSSMPSLVKEADYDKISDKTRSVYLSKRVYHLEKTHYLNS